MWSTSESLMVELADFMHADLNEQTNGQIARLWSLARREGLRQREEAVKAVVVARQSSYRPRRAHGSERPPEPAEPPRRVKLVRDVGGPQPDRVVTTLAGQTAHTKEEHQKQVKLDSLFQLVTEHVLDLHSLGASREDLADPLKAQTLRDTVMNSSSRLGVQRLSTLVSSFRRWVRYSQEHQLDVRKPTPLQLANYFKEVSQGGPTAASSMHACMKYFASTFGAEYDVEHWLTKSFKFHAQAHTSRQAPELEPWEFVNMLELFYKARGTQKLLLAMVLMPACACIRYEHLQRSSLVRNHGHWVEFHCSQGKARRFGARPAYDWALPEVPYRGHGVAKALCEFYAHEALGMEWLLPALALAADDLWEVTATTAFIVDKKMSRGRFLELFRGALCQSGLEVASAQRATYNRLRRFVPTIANTMRLGALDLQAVGSWTELPQGGGADPQVAKSKAVVPMGIHYAGGKTARSAQVKQRCLCRLLQIFNQRTTELARTPEGLLVPHCWKWPEFEAMVEMIPEAVFEPEVPLDIPEVIPPASVEESSSAPIEVAPGALPIEEATSEVDYDADEKEGAQSAPDSPDATSDTSSSSGSASDATAEARDLVGILEDDSAVLEASWFRQSKKIHLVRDEVDSRPSPWCRDSPFSQEPVERGVGFTSSSTVAFCQKCLARMPRGLYAAYAEYFGWAH